jgi:hypothetical protein
MLCERIFMELTASLQLKQLIVDFVMAIVSGAIAGLFAGWVLMGRQLHRELAARDASRILDIIRSLEETEINLIRNIRSTGSGDNDTQSYLALTDARDSLMKIALQAQYLLSERHKLLRCYLVLRIKRSSLKAIVGHREMVRFIQELVNETIRYVSKRSLVDVISFWFKTRFPPDEKKILMNATLRDRSSQSIILQGTSLYLHMFSYDLRIGELKELVKSGLLLKQNNEYSLTREGWRVAVKLIEGKYDAEAGTMIEI